MASPCGKKRHGKDVRNAVNTHDLTSAVGRGKIGNVGHCRRQIASVGDTVEKSEAVKRHNALSLAVENEKEREKSRTEHCELFPSVVIRKSAEIRAQYNRCQCKKTDNYADLSGVSAYLDNILGNCGQKKIETAEIHKS